MEEAIRGAANILTVFVSGVRNRKAGDFVVSSVLARVLEELKEDGRQPYRQETRG